MQEKVQTIFSGLGSYYYPNGRTWHRSHINEL